MAAHLFRRYVWLLDLVSRSGGITFDKISDEWERSSLNDRRGEPLPKRTLHNHIKAIEDMFDIKITCERQAGYAYVLKNNDNAPLSQTQQALLAQLRLTSAMISSPELKDRIVMGRKVMYKIITPILSAMESGRAVEIKASGRVRPGERVKRGETLTLEPYFIKQFNHWFVVGRVVEDGKVHAFSFDSIHHISQKEHNYTIPSDFDIQTYLLDPPYSSFEEGVVDDSAQLIYERSKDRFLYDDALRDIDNNVNISLSDLSNSPNAEYANRKLSCQSIADQFESAKV